MASPSAKFLLFALIVVLAANVSRSVVWRQIVLLVASLYFLSTFSNSFLTFIPLAAFVGLGYLGFVLVKRFPTRAWLFIVGVIGIFVWLKRYIVLPSGIFLPFPYLTIGLSYILFRVLHIMIDTHGGVLTEEVSPIRYLLYTLNFTTLSCGPIQKYSDFTRMMDTPSRPDLRQVGRALERVVVGVFKTNVLALLFSAAHTNTISSIENGTASNNLIAGIVVFASYPLFLYCNFSGYIDVVIGIASLLGITLPENFSRPFSADSLIEFWNRWHMTLSEWLKSYVYTPMLMGLMRRWPAHKIAWGVLSFFVTFFLIGAWHGQTAAFLFFGFLHGSGVSVNKLYQVVMANRLGNNSFRALSSHPLYVTATRGLTFTFFAFTLLWFWSSWSDLAKLCSSLSWPTVAAAWASVLLGSSVILAAWEVVRLKMLSIRWQGSPVVDSRYLRTSWKTALVVIAVVVAVLSNQPAPELVYKNF